MTDAAPPIPPLLAVIELVADKLPQTPSRTAPPGLIARIVMGGLTGACVASGGAQGIYFGAALGAIGGVVGCFAGYQARTGLVKTLNVRISMSLWSRISWQSPALCGWFRNSK